MIDGLEGLEVMNERRLKDFEIIRNEDHGLENSKILFKNMQYGLRGLEKIIE
jgi:hypothetical protein